MCPVCHMPQGLITQNSWASPWQNLCPQTEHCLSPSLLVCSLFSSSVLWLCPVFPTPTPALPRGRCSAWTLADVSVAAGHTDRSGLGSVLRDLVKPGDENLREMNKKLQNMLEEQLTKNMHLHKASVDHQPAHPSLQPPASLPT